MPMMKNSTFFYNIQKIRGEEKVHGFISDNDKFDVSPVVGPSDEAVKRIMDYADAYEALESESTGHIEILLN